MPKIWTGSKTDGPDQTPSSQPARSDTGSGDRRRLRHVQRPSRHALAVAVGGHSGFSHPERQKLES
ncbi:hypothetical protein APB71_34680, partial [Pseudomonas aeruginosa]